MVNGFPPTTKSMLRAFGMLMAALALQFPTDVVVMNSLVEIHREQLSHVTPL